MGIVICSSKMMIEKKKEKIDIKSNKINFYEKKRGIENIKRLKNVGHFFQNTKKVIHLFFIFQCKMFLNVSFPYSSLLEISIL